MDVGTVNDNKFASTKFHCPPILFRLEAKVCETLVLEQNQVFVKTASKQPQETKCIFNMIFELKSTSKRHLRPYWPQMVSELQDEF